MLLESNEQENGDSNTINGQSLDAPGPQSTDTQNLILQNPALPRKKIASKGICARQAKN